VADNPNILIIWEDDIGISNLSRYSDGLMGYGRVATIVTATNPISDSSTSPSPRPLPT